MSRVLSLMEPSLIVFLVTMFCGRGRIHVLAICAKSVVDVKPDPPPLSRQLLPGASRPLQALQVVRRTIYLRQGGIRRIMQVVAPRALRWTRDEYYRMAELGFFSGRRVELIKGEVIEMSPQDSLHASAIVLLDDAVRRIFGQGFVVRTQLPLSLGLDSDPEPDIAILKGGPRDHLRSHPDSAVLVIEAAGSSLEHDRTRKLGLYAQAGLQDYWIVNLVDEKLEVYRKPRQDPGEPFGFGYAEKMVLLPAQSVSPLALPGATILVSELLP
jgi:Uma2 family endonuclease